MISQNQIAYSRDFLLSYNNEVTCTSHLYTCRVRRKIYSDDSCFGGDIPSNLPISTLRSSSFRDPTHVKNSNEKRMLDMTPLSYFYDTVKTDFIELLLCSLSTFSCYLKFLNSGCLKSSILRLQQIEYETITLEKSVCYTRKLNEIQ